jgi:hypothetical protein
MTKRDKILKFVIFLFLDVNICPGYLSVSLSLDFFLAQTGTVQEAS